MPDSLTITIKPNVLFMEVYAYSILGDTVYYHTIGSVFLGGEIHCLLILNVYNVWGYMQDLAIVNLSYGGTMNFLIIVSVTSSGTMNFLVIVSLASRGTMN